MSSVGELGAGDESQYVLGDDGGDEDGGYGDSVAYMVVRRQVASRCKRARFSRENE